MVRAPCAFTAEGLGSVPGQGAEISQIARCGQKANKKSFKHRVII